MRRAASHEAFRASPEGCYVSDASWLHFCAHSTLWGVVVFGPQSREAAERLVRSLSIELEASVVPHAYYCDARRIAEIDPGAFGVLYEYVQRSLPRLKATRLALVVPAGIEGAIVSGFHGTLERPFPVEAFDTSTRAFAWLGCDQPGIDAELDELVAIARGTSPITEALRAFIATNFPTPAVDLACQALNLSERTLQRRLADAGTTFRRLVHEVRIEHAQRRLVESEEALTAIALDLGFASLQHFSSQFHKAVGVSPSAWRARRSKS